MVYIIILTETLDCTLPQDKVQGQRLALSNGAITVSPFKIPPEDVGRPNLRTLLAFRPIFSSDFDDFMCGI